VSLLISFYDLTTIFKELGERVICYLARLAPRKQFTVSCYPQFCITQALKTPEAMGKILVGGEFWEDGDELMAAAREEFGYGVLYENGKDLTVLSLWESSQYHFCKTSCSQLNARNSSCSF
jgi:hypothetical protein